MEWLDVVDINDEVVDRDKRHNVHAQGRIHRSAHILLFNSLGEVFVQLRSKSKDEGAGLWDSSAAGHVDSGESYLDCAVRELLEELGIDVDPQSLRFHGKISPSARNGFEFSAVYSVISDMPLTLQRDEIDDGRWLAPSQLITWMENDPDQFTDVFATVWRVVGGEASASA